MFRILAVAIVALAALAALPGEAAAEGPDLHPFYETAVSIAADGTYAHPPGRHCKIWDLDLGGGECKAQPERWPITDHTVTHGVDVIGDGKFDVADDAVPHDPGTATWGWDGKPSTCRPGMLATVGGGKWGGYLCNDGHVWQF